MDKLEALDNKLSPKDGTKFDFRIIVTVVGDPENPRQTTVAIGVEEGSNPPLAVMMAMTEQMMAMVALQSSVGFKQALTLLVDGAKKVKAQYTSGNSVS